MKTLRQILKAAKARCSKSFLLKNKNPGQNFDPAPSYWALVPIRPQESIVSKKANRTSNMK